MSTTLKERLRLLREGILLEAEEDEDKYDLPEDASGEEDESEEEEEQQEDSPEEGESDDSQDDDESQDDEEGEGDDDEPQTSDDIEGSDDSGESEDEDSPADDKPKVGEVLSLDNTSRKILVYKNFRKFRRLRDDVLDLITDLTEMPTLTDENRKIVELAVNKSTELADKLSDYITHRYSHNSYEVNYKNFMDFVLEKRLIEQILEEMNKSDGE